MRLPRFPVLALCAALAGCGAYVPVDSARMPISAQGVIAINETTAIELVEYQLRDPAATHGNPDLAARSLASVDWLAGREWLTGDYGSYAPAYRPVWQEFRRQARAAIGVAPGTPSQVVVDRLIAAAAAMRAGDRAGAAAQFQPPAFTLGPEGTLAALSNLPPLPGQARATAELIFHLHDESSRCRNQMEC